MSAQDDAILSSLPGLLLARARAERDAEEAYVARLWAIVDAAHRLPRPIAELFALRLALARADIAATDRRIRKLEVAERRAARSA